MRSMTIVKKFSVMAQYHYVYLTYAITVKGARLHPFSHSTNVWPVAFAELGRI